MAARFLASLEPCASLGNTHGACVKQQYSVAMRLAKASLRPPHVAGHKSRGVRGAEPPGRNGGQYSRLSGGKGVLAKASGAPEPEAKRLFRRGGNAVCGALTLVN